MRPTFKPANEIEYKNKYAYAYRIAAIAGCISSVELQPAG